MNEFQNETNFLATSQRQSAAEFVFRYEIVSTFSYRFSVVVLFSKFQD